MMMKITMMVGKMKVKSDDADVTFDEGREAPIGEVKGLSIALVSFLLYIRYDDHTIIP